MELSKRQLQIAQEEQVVYVVFENDIEVFRSHSFIKAKTRYINGDDNREFMIMGNGYSLVYDEYTQTFD